MNTEQNTARQAPTTPEQRRREMALEFAEAVAAQGFDVRLATERTATGRRTATWGIFSEAHDGDGGRVCYFQADGLAPGVSVNGCYAASRQSGTGWRIQEWLSPSDVTRAAVVGWLTACAPWWANSAPVYLTREQYLKDAAWMTWEKIEGPCGPVV